METHQATAFYTVISLISVFVSFIIYVCWKLVVSTTRAEGTYGVRPIHQRIVLSENIHPRRYNVSSQTNGSELLETRLKVLDLAFFKEETRRKSSSDSLHLSDTSHYQNCEAEKE